MKSFKEFLGEKSEGFYLDDKETKLSPSLEKDLSRIFSDFKSKYGAAIKQSPFDFISDGVEPLLIDLSNVPKGAAFYKEVNKWSDEINADQLLSIGIESMFYGDGMESVVIVGLVDTKWHAIDERKYSDETAIDEETPSEYIKQLRKTLGL